MNGDLINQLTVSVIFVKDILKPNCAYGSTFCLSATLVMYAQNTSTPGRTFGSMFEELIQESASPKKMLQTQTKLVKACMVIL